MTSPVLIDLYPKDCLAHPADEYGAPDIGKVIAAGYPWSGFVLKASQGDYYTSGAWFAKYWPMVRALAGDQYGVTFWRSAYHYLDVLVDATKQAHVFLSMIDKNGGWGAGDLWPWIDVEGSHNPPDASTAQIEDSVSTWARVVQLETGRKPTLYGNIYLAEHGVRSHMGCQNLVVARYTAELPRFVYERIGWTVADLLGWQYAGTENPPTLAGYPHQSPIGQVDMTAITIPGGNDYLRSHVFAETPA